MTEWKPALVALDIDGTILKWIDGGGTTREEISPAVKSAVRRALDAGAHVVLASGRSPHGMTEVADLLELHTAGAEKLWIVASAAACTSGTAWPIATPRAAQPSISMSLRPSPMASTSALVRPRWAQTCSRPEALETPTGARSSQAVQPTT